MNYCSFIKLISRWFYRKKGCHYSAGDKGRREGGVIIVTWEEGGGEGQNCHFDGVVIFE